MNTKKAITTLVAALAVSAPSFADDVDGNKFTDRDLLISTATADDQGALDAANAELAISNAELVEAQAVFEEADLAKQELDAAEQAVIDAQKSLDEANGALTQFEADLLLAQQAVTDAQKALEDAVAARTTDTTLLQADLDAATATLAGFDSTGLEAAVADAQATLDGANLTLSGLDAEAIDAALAGAQEILDGAQAKQAEDQAALDLIVAEFELTAALIGELSEEQIFALNRSLNNAVSSKLLVNLDAEHLQRVLDEGFNKQQINALTQGLEQSARFELKSGKFLAKYEETGDEKFLTHATRMQEKGVSQLSKFLAKTEAKSAAKAEAKGTAKAAAKGAAKTEAKAAAKAAAKGAAKAEAKAAAKGAAKAAAKAAAKTAAKGAAKAAAKKAARAG